MMMDKIRGAAQHFLFKILIGVIILSFILSGGFVYLSSPPTYAVKVNSEEISLQQFEQIFQSRAYMLADDADEDAINKMKTDILKGVVDELLITQYVKSLDLTISNEQVKSTISQYPDFLDENGNFDQEKYRTFLTDRGISGDQFAEYIRNRDLTPLISREISDSIFTLPSEVNEYAKLLLQKRTIRKAPIELSQFLDKQTISEDEIKTFYTDNTAKFTLPEAVKVSYVQLNRTDFLNRVEDSDEAVIAFYQEFIADKNFGIIQVATKTEAEQILTELKAGADFAELAKAKSLDVGTKASGGEIGMMSPSDLPPSLSELAKLNLNQVGQLSEIISVNNQFVIAKLLEIEDGMPEKDTPEYQALVAQMKTERSSDIFYDMLKTVGDILADDKTSLDKVAQASGLKVTMTEFFDRSNAPEALSSEPILMTAFSEELIGTQGVPRENSELLTINDDSAIVLRVEDHREKRVQTLDEVKETITQDLRKEKALNEVKALADKAIEGLRAGNNEALAALNTQFSAPQVLVTNSEEAEYRQDIEFLKSIFAIALPEKEGTPTYTQIVNKQGDLFIVALDAIEYPTPTDVEYKDFENRLNNLKVRQLYSNLMATLRKEAKIEFGDLGIDTSSIQ
ncbi:SurA N-terminal domain-containing protein [Thorsellia anophelis]|uniref:Periplasmic chaperone PpiD n=1 Tax=Thorsellia anophelis DSM 18579 TaxID=1123402 RepID=A0A1I0ANA8_9GAMM|nr:SurA N-terminal domain-containing protein [Thorsellia anophelis]SES95749.1 peptidyl-prolyl cis-trans isomerase D [Thorsellia anophelis DSM 18579]